MRRNIAILFLSWAAALTATSCGSATDTATSPSTTAGAKATTTTAKGQGNMDEKKCTALEAYLQSYLIGGREESKQAANQEKVLTGVNNTSANLKKAIPSITADVDAMTAYITKVVKGQPTTDADKDTVEKAKSKVQFFHNNCPKGADGGTGGGGGGGASTTKPATPTTKAGTATTKAAPTTAAPTTVAPTTAAPTEPPTTAAP